MDSVMFKMDSNQIMELCNFAYMVDKEARSDLISGYIATENNQSTGHPYILLVGLVCAYPVSLIFIICVFALSATFL